MKNLKQGLIPNQPLALSDLGGQMSAITNYRIGHLAFLGDSQRRDLNGFPIVEVRGLTMGGYLSTEFVVTPDNLPIYVEVEEVVSPYGL